MRILFAALPAYGHVLPLAPLALAAQEAGHQVEFAASAEFAGRLPGEVVNSVADGVDLQRVEREAASEVTDPQDPLAWPRAIFGVVTPRYVVPTLRAHWSATGLPDLVVHEGMNVGAGIAAAEAGVRAVAFNISLMPPAFVRDLVRGEMGYPTDTTIDPRPASWCRDDPPGGRIPIRTVAWSDATAARPTWPDESRDGPTAFVTLGTVSFGAVEVLRRSVLETADVCTRVVVAGPGADFDRLGSLPEHVHLERLVDQPYVLKNADVAIHHGGTGTVLACLEHGVPQVITPQGADQFPNADLLVQRGLARLVPNVASAGACSAAIVSVLEDGDLRERVDSVRREIAQMPTPDEVLRMLTG
ncbi:putative glycosyltransferase [Kineosphaera limosa NBRC 100340]|uniref:Putative glycosyltransferase n=1 Tax=Kineosphaera limosa NBRC 100340 TaxID=1184609 RepID=K6XHR3_9MICO|nr:nucleotide disphospho-sugar-binding domain-containing protein [Kineosphaera limosa]GAB98354.1 putative glycosyltransferase [Kineosphaera limosa NBRC 100340]